MWLYMMAIDYCLCGSVLMLSKENIITNKHIQSKWARNSFIPIALDFYNSSMIQHHVMPVDWNMGRNTDIHCRFYLIMQVLTCFVQVHYLDYSTDNVFWLSLTAVRGGDMCARAYIVSCWCIIHGQLCVTMLAITWYIYTCNYCK